MVLCKECSATVMIGDDCAKSATALVAALPLAVSPINYHRLSTTIRDLYMRPRSVAWNIGFDAIGCVVGFNRLGFDHLATSFNSLIELEGEVAAFDVGGDSELRVLELNCCDSCSHPSH